MICVAIQIDKFVLLFPFQVFYITNTWAHFVAIKMSGSCCVFVELILRFKYVKIDPIVHLYAKYIESVRIMYSSGLIDGS